MKSENTQQILHETKDIYNRIAPDFSDTRGKWWQPPIGLVKELRDDLRVLDLGCGNGRFAELFRGKNMEYLGIDNSEELIKICRQRFAGEKNIRFEVGDIINLSSIFLLCHPRPRSQSRAGSSGDPEMLDPGSSSRLRRDFARDDNKNNCDIKCEFDLVLMIAVLHHLPSKELRLRTLKNIYNVLAPGGKLIMRNWNLFNRKMAKQYCKRLLDFPYKISRGVWGCKDAFIPWKPLSRKNLRYVHSFTKNEMRKLLQDAGFSAINSYYESYSFDKPVSIWQGYNLVSEAVK